MKSIDKKTDIQICLEYFNDWLTIEKMAEHYQVKEKDLLKKIKAGCRSVDSIKYPDGTTGNLDVNIEKSSLI